MPEVSIIVPVYNTEQFLKRCIDSLLNQSFKDFEILLLDDESTDNSFTICLEYAKKDNRVKAIKFQHRGVANIRNKGVILSKGKYLMFCDSDDYVEKNWCEDLYNVIVLNHSSELIFCGYNRVYACKPDVVPSQIDNVSEITHYPTSEYGYFISKGLMFSLCNKIFNKEIILTNNLSFDTDIEEGEDLVFLVDYIKHCKSFIYVPVCTYNYANNSVPTITRSFQPHHYDSLRKMYLSRLSIISDKYLESLSNYYLNRFLFSITEVNDNKNTETKKEKLKYSNYILRDKAFRLSVKNSNNKGCNWKLRFVLFFRNYRLFNLFNKIINYKNLNSKKKS